MRDPISFDQDWHVKSTFSDGTATVAENVQAAEARGLRALCVVDAARKTSPWLPDLADACREADRESVLDVRSGVEVEVLSTNGTLELPSFTSRVDHLFVTADRLPTPTGPLDVPMARAQIEAGEILAARAVEWLVRAYGNATRHDAAVVLARPFAILPKLGIDPSGVHPAFTRWLAGVMLGNSASCELNELRHAPSLPAIDCFLTAGVPVLPATGAAAVESVGRFVWSPRLMSGLSSLARAA